MQQGKANLHIWQNYSNTQEANKISQQNVENKGKRIVNSVEIWGQSAYSSQYILHSVKSKNN